MFRVLVQRWIIKIPLRNRRIEQIRVVLLHLELCRLWWFQGVQRLDQGHAATDALDEIRVGDEETGKCHKIDVAVLVGEKGCCHFGYVSAWERNYVSFGRWEKGGRAFELTTSEDDPSKRVVQRSQLVQPRLLEIKRAVSRIWGFDQVHISKVERCNEFQEGGEGLQHRGVSNPALRTPRSETDPNAAGFAVEGLDRLLQRFDNKAAAVFNRAAVFVCPVINGILKELIEEIA